MKNFDVDALWQLERIGAPSLSPDGAQAVASVTRHSMETNKSAASLHLFSTLGGEPRRLTAAGEKDGQPQWSPSGELIAFIARREQEGAKDETPQLYVIPPDGGEARRIATVATGVDAFKWFPDGRRIAFVSWVRPQLAGTAAQAKAHKAFNERKESGYATEEAMYRFWDHYLPMERVPHLHVVDIASGKVRDLFEGSIHELTRAEPDASCFDISPDGKRIAFAFDPAAEKKFGNVQTLCEIEVKSGEVSTLLADPAWDFSAPRYSHGGNHLAFIASNQGVKHTMPSQLAVLDTKGRWAVMSADWDREVTAPLTWDEDDTALFFGAEDRGRRHVWRFDLAERQAAIAFEGGNTSSFALAAGALVVNHDSVQFPPRLSVQAEDGPRRIEHINDALLAQHRFSRHEEVTVKGARGDDVQMWLIYPPGFDAKKKHPVMHVVHGGPHTAFGDSWHWRWNHQAFAAQGYVVACVNYHGSSSFGFEFLDSITHHWGEFEQQDVEAGTDWLLKKSWVDGKRIFVTGGSYGGYMAAWLNGHVEPGRYAAYVCHAGCFDWRGMFADDCYAYHSKELGAWYWDDPARIAAQSPDTFAAHFSTPTLVIHGALDYRVPDAQGLAYYNTLKAQGVPARLLWFPDENHWILKPRNSKLWYGEFFAWLKRHDPKAR
ncbi:S9 family peptidase [Paucibacter sp. R3-3]|uniref:S9 family peptidase n=1 Tax=Roseateles agri TaxID=3098619 RepID=A0ABU5DL07_9BURK|nr:S9 family peptidase [Paucibacter sp. R3-3]MDY0746972.1 S9 family peptidase [Paucibacter sp. R3-3]